MGVSLCTLYIIIHSLQPNFAGTLSQVRVFFENKLDCYVQGQGTVKAKDRS